eukprot:353627-Chlamydomonas_euryale.AAC.2
MSADGGGHGSVTHAWMGLNSFMDMTLPKLMRIVATQEPSHAKNTALDTGICRRQCSLRFMLGTTCRMEIGKKLEKT